MLGQNNLSTLIWCMRKYVMSSLKNEENLNSRIDNALAKKGNKKEVKSITTKKKKQIYISEFSKKYKR